MELFHPEDIRELSNPGVVSRQLLNPESAPESRVTLTEVHLAPGAEQPRHVHDLSEQIWYALRGEAVLLLKDGEERPFRTGDVVRFAPGEIHGAHNDGTEVFVYVSVTTPPQSFDRAYKNRI